MKNKMSHVAIAVNNIEDAKKFFELLTGNNSSDSNPVESQKVLTSFIPIGDTNIELLQPSSSDSPISKFLDKKQGGIHHICIETDEFESLIDKVVNSGVRKLGDPFMGAKGRKVIFFHPKDTYGVLIELEEA